MYVETIINRGLNIVSPPEIRTLAHKNLNWQTVLRIFDIFLYIYTVITSLMKWADHRWPEEAVTSAGHTPLFSHLSSASRPTNTITRFAVIHSGFPAPNMHLCQQYQMLNSKRITIKFWIKVWRVSGVANWVSLCEVRLCVYFALFVYNQLRRQEGG